MLIPLRVDVPMDRKPWVNYALIAVIIVISLAAWIDPEFFMSVFDTPLGNTMLHAGLIHLIGNMLFLWVFGNAINSKFGQLGYLGLYLAVAGAAELAHIGFDGRPSIGASGAVNGIMGAFLVFFPRNDVAIAWWFWFRGGITYWSSAWLLLLYVGWDIFSLATSMDEGIALWAHVGGFVVGVSIALLCLITGLIRPNQDEESILQVLKLRNDN